MSGSGGPRLTHIDASGKAEMPATIRMQEGSAGELDGDVVQLPRQP